MEYIENQELHDGLDRISGFMILNVLYVACSALIITLPAATAGLFAVCTDWMRGKDSEALAGFFGGMRDHWQKATIIGLLDAVLYGLAINNLAVLLQMGLPEMILFTSLSITLLVGLVIAAANLYIWPLLVMYDLPLGDLLRISIKLAIAHFGQTMLLLALTLLALVAGLRLLPAMLSILFVFAGCICLVSWRSWHIIQRYDADLQRIQEGLAQ